MKQIHEQFISSLLDRDNGFAMYDFDYNPKNYSLRRKILSSSSKWRFPLFFVFVFEI